MNKLLLISLILYFISCKIDKNVIRDPFDVNHNISCEDLIRNGYKWMPGEDVILIGKVTHDTLDYYQLEYFDDKFIDFELEEVELDNETLSKMINFNDGEPAEVDSSFPGINFKENVPEICDNANPIWRYFKIRINPYDTFNYINNFDKKHLKVIDQSLANNYSLYSGIVINLSSNDTFNLDIFEENEKYYVATSINLKK